MPLLPLGSTNWRNPNTASATVSELKGDPDPLSEFDEYGTELHREARVWKVYVKETDKYDGDLVKGWNDSADVILVFAALFSAISSAFIIESSKMLQQDPLLVISQTLLVIANGTQAPGSISTSGGDSTDFTPTRIAICINTLWYLSLSLSLATSFIAILAKDWCHSFMKDQTGHPFDQTCRRQQKWDMIVRWKMSELLAFLPSVIHVALLLFGIGLCIMLWDTHVVVAVPVICVAGVALAFYISSSIAASFVDSFPYPTIISKIYRSELGQLLRQIFCELPFVAGLILSLAGVVFSFLLLSIIFFPLDVIHRALNQAEHRISSRDQRPHLRVLLLFLEPLLFLTGQIDELSHWIGDHFFEKYFDQMLPQLGRRIPKVRQGLEILVSLLKRWTKSGNRNGTGEASLKDSVSSQAVSWLITSCEVPQSVDIALQSIAGATNRISRPPLLECKAPLQILRRLASSNLYRDRDTKSEAVVSLYLRALSFLGTSGNPISNNGRKADSDLEASIWDLQMETERKLAAVIENSGFDPTPNDLEALRIGSTAASTSQKVLRKELGSADVRKIFDSIVELLQSHEDGAEELHETSLLSLTHAITLLLLAAPTSVARGHSDSKTLVTPWMSSGNFPELSGEGDFSDTSTLLRSCFQFLSKGRYSKQVTETAATCILLYATCMERVKTGQPYSLTWLEKVAHALAEGYVKGGANLEWIPSMKPAGTSSSQRTFDLRDYIYELGREFISEYQATHPAAHQTVETQPGAEVGSDVRKNLVGSGLYALGAVYSLGPVMAPSPALYASVVEIMCRTPPSSPLFACGAQMLSKWPFPTLSEELATALEQRDLVPLLETTSTSDNWTKRYFARGQLWLLLSVYIYAGDTASGRDKLKVELDKCRGNGDESEVDRHWRLGQEVCDVPIGGPMFCDLGFWAHRIDECTSQLLARTFVLGGEIAGVPPELRGLPSFTAWPRRAADPSMNEPRPVEEVTDEARERTDATNATTEGEGATDRGCHLQSAGLTADTGEDETQGEDDAVRADSSQDLEATTQEPPAGDGNCLADANSQEEVGEVRGEGSSGVEAEDDERRVADEGDATEATGGPQSEGEEAESEDVAHDGGKEGDVVIEMDRLETRSDRSMLGV